MRKKEISTIGCLVGYAVVIVLLICFAGYTVYTDMLNKHNQQVDPIANVSPGHPEFVLFFLVVAALTGNIFISKLNKFKNERKEHQKNNL